MDAQNDYNRSYEIPERLMNEGDALKICSIMEIDPQAVNNLHPLSPPASGGAARVKPYQTGDETPFLTRPEPKEVEIRVENPPSIPRSNIDYTDWPFKSTCLEFTITSEEVQKCAAWTWYRTGLLYDKAASQEADVESDQEGLSNYAEVGSDRDSSRAHIMRRRGQRAKAHALSLYPQLLEEECHDVPSWASPWTEEDTNYYAEIMRNSELQERSEAADGYKEIARAYIMQALDLFLEKKQEFDVEVMNKAPMSARDYMVKELKASGGLAQLWAQAAQWSMFGRESPHWVFMYQFRRWWVRAAMARGHGEWLEKEGHAEYLGRSGCPSIRPSDRWKLLHPVPVGCYENDCAVNSVLTVNALKEGKTDCPYPWYPDDEYFTLYNITIVRLEDLRAMEGHERLSSIYGAPDFVYLEKAKTGWLSDTLGILPADRDTALYERYERKGLIDFMPSTASEYEKAIAVCADDLITEIVHIRSNEEAYETLAEPVSARLAAILTQLSLVATRRFAMTKAEADACQFKSVVTRIIGNFIDTLPLTDPLTGLQHMALMHIQHLLGRITRPWLDPVIMIKPTGAPLVILVEPQSFKNEECTDPRVAWAWDEYESIPSLMRYYHQAWFLDLLCDIQELSAEGIGRLEPIHRRVCMLYGEGREAPIVTSGLLEARKCDILHRSATWRNEPQEEGTPDES